MAESRASRMARSTQISCHLLKCRFWFNRSGVGPRFCISNKLPGEGDTVGAVACLDRALHCDPRSQQLTGCSRRLSHLLDDSDQCITVSLGCGDPLTSMPSLSPSLGGTREHLPVGDFMLLSKLLGVHSKNIY